VLQPHTSWSKSFTRRASQAGSYKVTMSASDRFGRSRATATATAG
jgi:hypothetical protein